MHPIAKLQLLLLLARLLNGVAKIWLQGDHPRLEIVTEVPVNSQKNMLGTRICSTYAGAGVSSPNQGKP